MACTVLGSILRLSSGQARSPRTVVSLSAHPEHVEGQTERIDANRLLHSTSPVIIDRGKTVTQCKPRGKPFRPRSIGLYLVGRHPLRSNGGGSHGPGLNVTSTSLCPQPPGLASRSRSQERESRGDTKAGAPKRSRVKVQKMFG